MSGISCDRCILAYEPTREEPPCEQCYVELSNENSETIRIFNLAVSQTNVNGALDYNAIKFLMNLYNIDNKRIVFENILYCFNVVRQMEQDKEKGKKVAK